MDEYESMDANLGRHALDLARQEWGSLRSIDAALRGLVAEPDRTCTVGGHWYVVSIEHQQEDMAKGEIATRGMVPYLPVLPRRERPRRGVPRTTYRPMLGLYMFVRALPSQLPSVTGLRGVRRLLGNDGHPQAIDDACIEVIRLIEAEEREIEDERARMDELIAKAKAKAEAGGRSGIIWHFTPGDRVRIKNGPFAGFYADLTAAVDSHDRIRVFVGLFGTQSLVELSAFDIEKAA